MGYKAEDYINLLQLKSQQQKDETISQSHIADPILKFMESRSSYNGTAAEFLGEISLQEFGKIVNNSGFESIEPPKILPEYWPKDPTRFSKEVRRIGFVLESQGLKVTFKREGRKRFIKLTKKESFGKNSGISVTETQFIDDKTTDDAAVILPNSTVISVTNDGSYNQVGDAMTLEDAKQKGSVITYLSSNHPIQSTLMTLNSESKLSGNLFGIYTRDELMAAVRESDKGQGVDSQVLAAQSKNPNFSRLISVCLRDGDLIEPRPGFLAVRI